MKTIHIQELYDYLFCHEYWRSKKKSQAYALNEDFFAQQKRYEKRKKQVELHAKLKKELLEERKKDPPSNWFVTLLFDLKWKKIDFSLILWVTTSLILGYYFGDYVYLFLFAPAVYFLATEWRTPVFRYLERKVPTERLLKNEKKHNPSLLLYNFTNTPYLYGKLDIIEKNNFYYILLDRAEENMPRSEHEKQRDEMQLVALMNIFHTHFFSRRIIGQIRYRNGSRKLEWMGKKNQVNPKVTKYLSEIQQLTEVLQQPPSTSTPPLTQCQRCKFSSHCPSYQQRFLTP